MTIENAQFKLLDCTLRDGGYYNQWMFSKQLAEEMVRSIAETGIDIIELGYKTSVHSQPKSFQGLFRYCTESQLTFLNHYPEVQFCFMADAKEFSPGGKVDLSTEAGNIFPAKDSVFSWVRVATHFNTYQEALELARQFKELGYQVGLNLMGISLLSQEQIVTVLKEVDTNVIEVFYFADSFGNLEQADVLHYMELIRAHYSGQIGIHTHDNQGLAFANTLEAIKAGVNFVDSTLLGMGRGAGNLKTEQLLLYLYFHLKNKKINPNSILGVLEKYFIPMHQQYQWGWDYSYMLSALENIHPTYCQTLRVTAYKQYSMEQICQILNGIESGKRQKYDEAALFEAIDQSIHAPMDAGEDLHPLPRYQPSKTDSVLVIATGPCLKDYTSEIKELIEQKQPLVIECNPEDSTFQVLAKNYYRAILNWVRLKEVLDHESETPAPTLTGMQSLPKEYAHRTGLEHFPCRVHPEVKVDDSEVSLPAFVVGMYAVALASLSQPDTIFLAGFDGYPNPEHQSHQEMEQFWKGLKTSSQLLSVTPTTYSLNNSPIYRWIK